MQKKKKETNRSAKRAEYQAPRAQCFSVEAEGIMAGSGGYPRFGEGLGTGINNVGIQDYGVSGGPGGGIQPPTPGPTTVIRNLTGVSGMGVSTVDIDDF